MAKESNGSILTEADKANLTPEEQDAIVQAYNDVLLEFAACAGEAPDDDALDVIRQHFTDTIKKGMLATGIHIWVEPHKSFALKYVCKIGRRSKRCGDSDLDGEANKAIAKARKACDKVVEDAKIGLLCPTK